VWSEKPASNARRYSHCDFSVSCGAQAAHKAASMEAGWDWREPRRRGLDPLSPSSSSRPRPGVRLGRCRAEHEMRPVAWRSSSCRSSWAFDHHGAGVAAVLCGMGTAKQAAEPAAPHYGSWLDASRLAAQGGGVAFMCKSREKTEPATAQCRVVALSVDVLISAASAFFARVLLH
jgi:hypothetical protein